MTQGRRSSPCETRPFAIRGRSFETLYLIVSFLGTLQAWAIPAAPKPRDPASVDQETFRLSKNLQPVPTQLWQEIAGSHFSEAYAIVSGDTLYDISKRFFGDGKYWPKIWSLNNQSITNPHLIRPGKQITFNAGSGTELPSVSVTPSTLAAQSDAGSGSGSSNDTAKTPPLPAQNSAESHPTSRGNSREWADLPRQRWENMPVTFKEQIEQVGLERDAKEKLRVDVSEIKFIPQAIATTSQIRPLGEIIASTSNSAYFYLGDSIFVRAHPGGGNLVVGQTYAVAGDPIPLDAVRTEIHGFSYPIMGQVLIESENNGLFKGKIVALNHFLSRGTFLIPVPQPIPVLKPIPGPSPMEAGVLRGHDSLTFALSQHKLVFIDRGSEDKIAPGMVFQIFSDKDPYSELKISANRSNKIADLMVIQVSERFSAAIVTQSTQHFSERTVASLVTDPALLQDKSAGRPQGDISKPVFGDLEN